MEFRTLSAAPSPAGRVSCIWNRYRGLVLVAVVFLLFSPSLGGGFIWDDDTHLTQNLITRPGGLFDSWFTTRQPNYWPVTWTAFWVEWKLWGVSPAPYHFVNIALHAGCVLLVWRLLAALSLPGAWLSALIFAIHPVTVETVTWITQLKTLLSTLLFLVSLLLFLRLEKTSPPRRTLYYVLSLAAYAGALLSRSSTAVLPVVILGCLGWRSGRSAWRWWPWLLPYLLLGAAQVAGEVWFQTFRANAGTWVSEDGPLVRTLGAGRVVLFYLEKLFVPVNLSFVYPRWTVRPDRAVSYLPDAVLLLAFAAAWARRRTWGRAVLFGFGTYVVTLLPVLGFADVFFFRYSYVADHYQYLSMIGVIGLVVGGVSALTAGRSSSWRRAAGVAAGMVVILFAVLTWLRQPVLWSSERIWRDTLFSNPECWLAHNNLGNILLYERGDASGAVPCYRAAAALTPEDFGIQSNLSWALLQSGDPAGAEKVALEMISRHPDRDGGYLSLGDVYLATGNHSKAARAFQEAVKREPGLVQAYLQLGIALYREGNLREAEAALRKGIALHPRSRELSGALAELLGQDERTSAPSSRSGNP